MVALNATKLFLVVLEKKNTQDLMWKLGTKNKPWTQSTNESNCFCKEPSRPTKMRTKTWYTIFCHCFSIILWYYKNESHWSTYNLCFGTTKHIFKIGKNLGYLNKNKLDLMQKKTSQFVVPHDIGKIRRKIWT